MSSSFVLPSFETMKTIDLSSFSDKQRDYSEQLSAHLHILHMVLTFFDSEEIRDDFITTYSNYMAHKCIIQRRNGPRHSDMAEEIRFFLPANNIILNLLEIENVMYTRRSDHPITFIQICTSFLERNLPVSGIFTESWVPISVEFFETLGSRNDTISLCVAVGNNPDVLSRFGETDRWFEGYREHLVRETYAETHQHHVHIADEKFIITDENKDDMNECKLCYSEESLYACESCKYPICKSCLKHILKSTGICPCCREKNLSMMVIQRDDSQKELIDDLNFDYQPENNNNSSFKPEEINEELDDDLHGNHGSDPNRNYDISLREPLNDSDDDDDDDEDYLNDDEREDVPPSIRDHPDLDNVSSTLNNIYNSNDNSDVFYNLSSNNIFMNRRGSNLVRGNMNTMSNNSNRNVRAARPLRIITPVRTLQRSNPEPRVTLNYNVEDEFDDEQ